MITHTPLATTFEMEIIIRSTPRVAREIIEQGNIEKWYFPAFYNPPD